MERFELNAEWADVSREAFCFYSAEVVRVLKVIEGMKEKDRGATGSRLESYVRFIAFLFEGDLEYPGPYMNPLSMQKQLTFDQYIRFIVQDKRTKKEICETLQRMENYGKKNYFKKDRKYLGMTLRDWMDKRGEGGGPKPGAASTPVRIRQ